MRAIIDDIVEGNMIQSWEGEEYLNNPMYMGNVETKPLKVNLSASEFGLKPLSICTSLEEKFSSVGPREGKCSLTVGTGGSELKAEISSVQMRILKALVLEQVNACTEYSSAVARVYWAYTMFLVLKDKSGFKLSGNESKIEVSVMNKCKEFIMQKTGDELEC